MESKAIHTIRKQRHALAALAVLVFISVFHNILKDTECNKLFYGSVIDNGHDITDFDGFAIPENWEESAAAIAASIANDGPKYTISPYNLTDVLLSADIFDNNYATVVWDPAEDRFIGYYSHRHWWVHGNTKLMFSIKKMTYMLRATFPWRFQKGINPEFAFGISSGDYPAVTATKCVLERTSLPCKETAPILHFGSAFRKPLFPSMIPMPMPEYHHIKCFEQWVKFKNICPGLKSISNGGELAFSDEVQKTWDQLIPQVVWRGTDFGYLGMLGNYLDRPTYEKYIAGKINPRRVPLKETTRIMRANYDNLVPRWQGVVLTAEAKIEAGGKRGMLPWANIKFSSYIDKGEKTPTLGAYEYNQWMDNDFPVAGQGMSQRELGTYRYHIDLGGGGGTTWSGTIEKLAMPGLLFHHVTPTKDYIHDHMIPWTHYIPVAADLRDLKEKFDWAESHPMEAQQIANQGSNLVRRLGTLEGFEELFKENFEAPLLKMIKAYQPVGQDEWKSVMVEMDGDLLEPVISCNGLGVYDSDCPRIVGNDPFKERNQIAPPRPQL